MKSAKGALVAEVEKNSPADKAGILTGDVILSFDSKNVENMRKLPRIVADTKSGKKVSVEVLRKGERKALLVTVALLEDDSKKATSNKLSNNDDKNSKNDTRTFAGLTFKNIEFSDRKRFNLSKDVTGVLIVEIDNDSKAAQKPIKVGDVVSSINQNEVSSIENTESILKKAKSDNKKSALLLIYRGSNASFITLPLN